jgi:hypothetical protein
VQRVRIYLRLHLLPLRPLWWVRFWWLVVQLYPVPSAKSNCTSNTAPARSNTKRELRTKRRMRTQLRKRMRTGHTRLHDRHCFTTSRFYLIGSLWRVIISSCESHRRCCGGENRRKHRHLSTSTARAHPLPRQLLQSKTWAHSQQYSAQSARTKELTRKNSWRVARSRTFGWTSCIVSRNSRTFPNPSGLLG